MTWLSLRRRVGTSSSQRHDKSITESSKFHQLNISSLLSLIHRWWHNNQLLKGESTILNDKQVQNILHLKRLNRTDLLSSFMCHSSNNNITDPITASVMIDLNCKLNMHTLSFDLNLMTQLFAISTGVKITLGDENSHSTNYIMLRK